ncbi:MAG: hypothetical protein AB7K09_17555 [Planctomycetota bacterium]
MNRSIAIGMLLGMALVAGLWLVASSQGPVQSATPGPEQVVRRFLDAARTGNVDGMLDAVGDAATQDSIEKQRYMIMRLVHEDASTRPKSNAAAASSASSSSAVSSDGKAPAGGAPGTAAGDVPVFAFRYEVIPERTQIGTNDDARVVARLYRHGNETLMEYRLMKTDGQWRIHSSKPVTDDAPGRTPAPGGPGGSGKSGDNSSLVNENRPAR